MTSRFAIHMAAIVSLSCREQRCDNSCHRDSDGSGRCYFGCVQAKKRTMASKVKKPRAKWDSEVERKLINIWAHLIEEFDGKLITRKKKEAIVITHVLHPDLLSKCSPKSTWSSKGANCVLKKRQNQQRRPRKQSKQ